MFLKNSNCDFSFFKKFDVSVNNKVACIADLFEYLQTKITDDF